MGPCMIDGNEGQMSYGLFPFPEPVRVLSRKSELILF